MVPGAPPADPDGTDAANVDSRIREAVVLAFANKLESYARQDRDLPPKWRYPMVLARPLLDALGAISVGFLAANISILIIFIIFNLLLHQ